MTNDETILESDFQPLPVFQTSGFLAAGVYECSLHDLAWRTCFNQHRAMMWRQLTSFLCFPLYSHDFDFAYVGSRFLSLEAKPPVIDVLLETSEPLGPDSLAAVSHYFVGGIDRIELMFGIDLHFRLEGAPMALFEGPFSRLDDSRCDSDGSSTAGVARLNLSAPDILTNLQNLIREG